jgi:hypothetical protein
MKRTRAEIGNCVSMPWVNKVCNTKFCEQADLARWCSRKAGAAVEDVDPLVDQAKAGVLSVVVTICVGASVWRGAAR